MASACVLAPVRTIVSAPKGAKYAFKQRLNNASATDDYPNGFYVYLSVLSKPYQCDAADVPVQAAALTPEQNSVIADFKAALRAEGKLRACVAHPRDLLFQKAYVSKPTEGKYPADPWTCLTEDGCLFDLVHISNAFLHANPNINNMRTSPFRQTPCALVFNSQWYFVHPTYPEEFESLKALERVVFEVVNPQNIDSLDKAHDKTVATMSRFYCR